MTSEDAIAIAQGVAGAKGWSLTEPFHAHKHGSEWLVSSPLPDEALLDVGMACIAVDDVTGRITSSTYSPPKDRRPPPRLEGAPRLPVTRDEALRLAIEAAEAQGRVLFRPQATRRREFLIAGRCSWDVIGHYPETRIRIDEQSGRILEIWVVLR